MTSKHKTLIRLFEAARVIPVITVDRVENAVPLARALIAGGVRTLEITLRTEAAFEAAKAIIVSVPDAIVGMGTVLNAADLGQAVSIGAKFALSPGATPELLEAASRCDVPFVPGIATASELMAALAHGLKEVLVVSLLFGVAAGEGPLLLLVGLHGARAGRDGRVLFAVILQEGFGGGFAEGVGGLAWLPVAGAGLDGGLFVIWGSLKAGLRTGLFERGASACRGQIRAP